MRYQFFWQSPLPHVPSETVTTLPHDENKTSLASQGTGTRITAEVARYSWCRAWPWQEGTRWLTYNKQSGNWTYVCIVTWNWRHAKKKIFLFFFFFLSRLFLRKGCLVGWQPVNVKWKLKNSTYFSVGTFTA